MSLSPTLPSSPAPLHVVWFKKDLRVEDHAPLAAATRRVREQGGRLLCVYVYEDSIIGEEDVSRRHLLFLNQSLDELNCALEQRGQSLLRVRGEVVDALNGLKRYGLILGLWSHEETGNRATYERDRAVAAWCREQGVEWQELPQTGVVRRLKNRDGWSRSWGKRMAAPVIAVPKRLPAGVLELCERDTGSLAPEVFGKTSLGEDEALLQRGGRQAGLELLDTFLYQRGQMYTKAMSSPVTAFEACSRLSPYLTYGTLSVREVYQKAKERQGELKELEAKTKPEITVRAEWRAAMRSFLGRLRWHCHFMQKLEDEPELEFHNLFRACDGLRENDWDEAKFQAWAEGLTGYPLVDACMRALRASGWINFRMRAMLMSFASYHLWLHWRPTGMYLAQLFMDYEPGIHWSQVQMQSGTTGINSIRIYSPSKQATDQDPDGTFIRKWVPELVDIPDSYLFEPWMMPELEQQMSGIRIGQDYPAAIVDHATVYRYAQQRIRSVGRDESGRSERQRIFQKHGSRRGPRKRKQGATRT